MFYFQEGLNLYCNQNKISNLFPFRCDNARVCQNYILLLLPIAIMYVGIIGILLLTDIHQLMFPNTLWYKALKVCSRLNCKNHPTIRLSPVMDSGVRTDPSAAMA